jgi:surface polysaccharide O-acyltransferase-like enzyme
LERNSVDSKGKLAIPDDLIRTLAIFLVVLLHSSLMTLQLYPSSSAYWWTASVYKSIALPCVPLFIMLSGALLLQPVKVNEPIRVFLRKRLGRVGLAFAFWTVIYTIWSFYISRTPLTLANIGQSISFDLFGGAYYQFWFIYLIGGLYLITPILRVVITYGGDKMIRYLILVWFVGVAVVPLLQLATCFILNDNLFVIGGWVGYFVLGIYLLKVKLRSALLFGLLVIGFVWTIFGVWLMNYPVIGVQRQNFFIDPLTANVIIGSVALFMILLKFRPDWPGSNQTVGKRLVQAISRNTLPIFLFHVIILESFERGFFGFTLSPLTLNPIIEIPLIANLTFFITLGLVLLMRKVPILNKLIG